jgi:hypothetical protein
MAEGIFSQYERDELNKITAKSILEKLMNIRQNINVNFTARRLVWELMQNAKDNASLCNEIPELVDITINIRAEEFVFSHSKGYFTNEHIRGLIRKYSSSDKDRDPEQAGEIPKATGRFGTGFMTTHLLSEKVQIESYYKNGDSTFSKFSYWLDRSGRGEKEIIQGINRAFENAEESIKSSQKELVNTDQFRTSFTYPVTENKHGLAEIAIKEVKNGIAYTLINVPELNSVAIDDDLLDKTTYEIELTDTITYKADQFQIYTLKINGKKTDQCFIAVEDKDVRIIIPVLQNKGKYSAIELNSSIPRLHLDFPMIGTEDLNLPFVVNCPLFEPTEPRDGISLTYDDNTVSQTNCKIMLNAVSLYENFLSFVGEKIEWNNLYNLARIKQPKKHPWIDPEWFKSNIVAPIQEKLLHTPLVDVVNGGRISILDEQNEMLAYFPYAEKGDVREKLWHLTQQLYPRLVPVRDHIDHWYNIIWNECKKFSITELSEDIQKRENLANLSELFEGKEKHALDFLNSYYDLLNFEKNHIKDIIADKYKVIPNQLGEFQNKSELFLEDQIDEEVKNVYALVQSDPRSFLRHNDVITASNYKEIESTLKYYQKKQAQLVAEINTLIKEKKVEDPYIVCDYLVSLFPEKDVPDKRTKLFDFSKKIFPDDFTRKRKLQYYDESIWEESDKTSVFIIVSKVSEQKNVETAYSQFGFVSSSTFITWLNSLIGFLVNEGFEGNINRVKHPILPNQNGVFCTKDDLFLDSGDIDEELKDISGELGYDFRDELLDSSIYLELTENRTYTIENVSEKISAFIKPILRDVDKRKEHKETLKKFYLWMNSNRDRAEEYFSDLFEKRFLFLEDDDISKNIKKATDLDKLMEEHGIESIDELRIRLSKIRDDDDAETNSPEKIAITKEILASLGISSPEDFIKAFKDPSISSRFYHTSVPTREMYQYAQNLILRAKENIIKFLGEHKDYDCSDIEETAPTTLAGILKNGVSIQIVTRPSDHKEVLIYYTSETDTLDTINSELWVDDGVSDPHILTLGRILKSTGINRIPINLIN